jgi:hypothetical protein
MNESPPVEAPVDLWASLERWVVQGYLTREQADRILADETARSGGPAPAAVAPVAAKPVSFVTEALGYVGGILILVAVSIITTIYWENLELGVRLGLAGSAAVALLVGGWALPEPLGSATSRLRAVLWFLSTAALSLFLGVMGADAFHWPAKDVALLAAGGTAVFAAALWVRHPSVLQHVAFFASLAVAVGVTTAHLPGGNASTAGLAVWGLGTIWMTLAWGGLLMPRPLALVLGAIATLTGAQMAMTADWGHALGLATVVGILALAVLFHDLLLLAVGALGALVTLPSTVAELFPGALGPPLAMLGVGVILVGIALRTVRRPPPGSSGNAPRDYTTGAPAIALAAAGVVAVAVTATVIAIGLS